MTERPTVLLDPANPYDFDPGELEQLAHELEADVPGVSIVPVRRPEEGYGGPLMEVVHVWQTYSTDLEHAAIDIAVAKWLINRLRERWQRDCAEHPPPELPRRRVFNLYNEQEELVRSVTIDLPDGEPTEDEVKPGKLAPHPRPQPDAGPGQEDSRASHSSAVASSVRSRPRRGGERP